MRNYKYLLLAHVSVRYNTLESRDMYSFSLDADTVSESLLERPGHSLGQEKTPNIPRHLKALQSGQGGWVRLRLKQLCDSI